MLLLAVASLLLLFGLSPENQQPKAASTSQFIASADYVAAWGNASS